MSTGVLGPEWELVGPTSKPEDAAAAVTRERPKKRRPSPTPKPTPPPRRPAQPASRPPATKPPVSKPQPRLTKLEVEGEQFEFDQEYTPESIARWLNKNRPDYRRKLTQEKAGGRSQAYDAGLEQALRKSTPISQEGMAEWAEFLSGEDDKGNPVVVKPEGVTPQALEYAIEKRKEYAEDVAKEPHNTVALNDFIDDTAAMERDLERRWSSETTLEYRQRRAIARGDDPSKETVTPEEARDANTWLTEVAKSGVAFEDGDTAKEERILRDRFARHFPDEHLPDEALGRYREVRRVYGIARWINKQTPAGIGQREADEFARAVKPEDRQVVLAAVYELRADRPKEEKDTLGKMNVSIQQGLQRLSSTIGRKIRPMTDDQRVYARQLRDVVEGMNPVLEGDEPWYQRWPIQAAGMVPEMGAMVGVGKAATGAAKKLGLGKVYTWLAGATGITAAQAPVIFDQEYDTLLEQKVDPRTAFWVAATSSLIQGATESITMNPFVGNAGIPVKAALRKRLTAAAKEGVRRYGGEWFEEYAQGVTGEVANEFALQWDEKDRPGYWKKIKAGLYQGWKAGGPLLILTGPGTAANVARAIDPRLHEETVQRLTMLNSVREKGFVSEEDAKELELSPEDSTNRKTRWEAVGREIEETKAQLEALPEQEEAAPEDEVVPAEPETEAEGEEVVPAPFVGQIPEPPPVPGREAAPEPTPAAPTTPAQAPEAPGLPKPTQSLKSPPAVAQEPPGAVPENTWVEVSPAKYAKNSVAVQTKSVQGFKSRAARLTEALKGRYSGRERAYIMSKAKAAKLQKMLDEGWDANSVSKELIPPETVSNYSDLDGPQLAAVAKSRGMTGYSGKKVAELRPMLEEDDRQRAAVPEAPAETGEQVSLEAEEVVPEEDLPAAERIVAGEKMADVLGESAEEAPPVQPQQPQSQQPAAGQPGGDIDVEPSAEFGKDPSTGVGIVTTVPVTPPRGGIGRAIGHFFQRFFTARGELPAEVYDAKVRKEGRVAKQMSKLRFAATDFRRGTRKALGGKELTQADVEKMNAVLRGEAEMTTVPDEVRAPLQAMRDHIDALSRALIAEGVAQGDLVGIIDNNMGVYATRSYRVFDDPKWRDNVPEGVRNRAIATIREMYPEKSDAEVVGILESLLFRGAAESPASLLKGSKLGSKDLSVFMQRKDVPEWLRDLWGEYKDAGVNYARSVFKMSRLSANQQFLNEVREAGLGKWLRTEEDGPVVNEYGEVITPIAAERDSVMSPLDGLYTTPEIKAAFERFDSPGAMPDWLRVMMSVNYVVKYGKTVGSMMTHVRNFVSNAGFATANGHWRLDQAGKALWATATGTFRLPGTEFRTYYEHVAELGLVGEDVRAGELKDALRDASKADIDEYLYNREQRHAKKIVKVARGGYQLLNALYQAEDGVWKIYAWENEKARYAKAYPEWSQQQVEEHAAKIVRDTYPTYSKISEGVKAVRRFPLVGTFVSFPAEVVRTTFNAVNIGLQEMQTPETRAIGAQRLVGTAIALGGLSILSRAMMAMFGIGDDEDDDLRWFVAPWQENSRFVYTSKPKNAIYSFVDLGYSDPHAYLSDSVVAFMRGDDWRESLWNATAEFLRPFASEEILAKALMDLRSNEDQKIYNPKDTAGEQAKGMVAHMWNEALEPGTISSVRRIADPDRDTALEVIKLFTGQKLQEADVEHSLGFRVRDFGRALSDIQSIARKTATSRGTATGEMVATDLARMEKLRLAEFAEMQRIVGAARRLGVSEKSIHTLLEDELPDDVAEQLMTGDYSPYEMTPQTVQQMLEARPEEFKERFAAWHGDKLPEAVKKFAMPKIGSLPAPRPDEPDKAEKYDRTIQTTKETLDALGVSHAQAQQLLVEHYRKPGKDGKPQISSEGMVLTEKDERTARRSGFDDSYIEKATALAKLYGHSAPKKAWLEVYHSQEFKAWNAKWWDETRAKLAK